jgi:DNA-binding response OmpR family regulator
MKKTKILLLEDDELASELIYNFLTDYDFDVFPVFTATDGIAQIKNQDYDLLILDINLPDFNGFEVLKSLKNHVSLPIIVTSAYSDTKSKLLAFRYGASDYMVKPLDLEELEARIWVQLSKNSQISIQEEKKRFSIQGSKIYFEDNELDLTSIEFDILSMLIKNANTVIKREELVESLSSLSSHRSLDNHIKNIRKKIGDNGNKAIYLKTIYGVGYSLQQS